MLTKIKYVLCTVSLTLVLSLLGAMAYADAESSDYETHWAAKEISKWQAAEIIEGYPDGSYRPDAPITRAEFLKVIAATIGIKETAAIAFQDVPADAWYNDAVAKAFAAGYVQGDGNGAVRPNDPITRQEAAKILAIAFQVPAAASEADRFKDGSELADWSKGYVGGLAQLGYIQGYDDQTFRPAKRITRAESVTMLDSLAGALYLRAGTYADKELPGNAVINTGDVLLKNVTIQGNLYLTGGIGEGNAALDNVTVKGETIVSGGGVNSIHFKDSNLNKVTVNKKDGQVRLAAEGNTVINKTELQSAAKLETSGAAGDPFKEVVIGEKAPVEGDVVLKGNFGTVTMLTAKVTMESGSIKVLTIPSNAAGASMNIAGGTVVTLEAGSGASIVISGNAKVSSINVLGDGVQINGQGAEKGSVVQVEGGIVTGTTTPSSGGSTGSNPGGSSGGNTGGSTGGSPDGGLNGGSSGGSEGGSDDGSNGGSDGGSDGSSKVQVTGVSLNQTAVSLRVNETLTITATVAPANADNKNVRWSSGNEQVATVENGKITAKAEGTAVITVITEDGNKTAVSTVTVTKQAEEAIIYDVTTRVDEVSKKVGMEGFIRSGGGKAITVKITDPQGNIDWIGQTVSGTDGKFTVAFAPHNKMAGPYSAALGTNGLEAPVIVKFNVVSAP